MHDGSHSIALDAEGMRPAGLSRRTRYRYVEFAARALPGFRNHVVRVEEVPRLLERWGPEECFASIFRFSAEVLLHLAETRVEGRPSLAGYEGAIWAPFLPIDVDAHGPGHDLGDALEATRRVHALLIGRWRVAESAVHVYFSGAKGFHILVDTRAAGRLVPARNLHRVFMRVRLAIHEELPRNARALFDLGIGDKMRLLRLPNTRHADGGLFKVALTTAELHDCSTAEIRELARAPRPLAGVACAGLDPLGAVAPAPPLVERFERARRALRAERGSHPYSFGTPPLVADNALCPARRAMWRADVPPGQRNNVAIRLASAFRLAGYNPSQSLALLRQWGARQARPLPAQEIEAVVHSAYVRPYAYGYGCRDPVIRAFCPYAGRFEDCAARPTRPRRSERNDESTADTSPLARCGYDP
jgi:hypothetical protein